MVILRKMLVREENESIQATLYRTATGSIDVRTLHRVGLSQTINRQKEKPEEYNHRKKKKTLANGLREGGKRDNSGSQASQATE